MEVVNVKEIKYFLKQSSCMNGNMQKQALTLINELENTIDEQYKRIMELEQDLIHADENVFYRECNVALQENKIKFEALKCFFEWVIDIFINAQNKKSTVKTVLKELNAEDKKSQDNHSE